MEFTGALQAVIDGYRSRTDELLPVYFLSPAVTQLARVVAMTGLAAAYGILAATGRLARFRADLRAAEDPPDPAAGIEGYQAWFEGVSPAFERLLLPEVLWLLAATLLATVAVFAVLHAVAVAAQLSCCWATMCDERATTAAIAGASRHWQPILGVLVVQVVLVGGLTAAAAGAVLLVAATSPLAGIALALPVGILWLVAVTAIRVVTAFATVAVVVDGAGTGGGLRGGFGFVRANPQWALGYVVAVIGVLALIGSAAASGGGSGAASALLSFVVVSPTLDLLKAALYGDHAGTVTPPAAPERSVLTQVRAGLRRGVDEMRAFVGRRPGLHVLAALLLAAGAVAGWLLAAPYQGLVETSIESRLADHTARTAVVGFTTNNVAVAVSTAFSGLAFGVPTAVAMLFNGALFGALARLEAAPLVLVAFVVPHALIELPALVVAGAVGFSLAESAWHAHRGGRRVDLADAIERAFWILVGVAVLLAVAGLVEGLFSPYYFRPFLAG